MEASLAALQQRLQHSFKDARLLQMAVTHRSFSAQHNERLEFLGDSVLNLAVASLLYSRLGDLSEGDLSRTRANLVKQDTLHGIAMTLALAPVLRLGEGEMRSGGRSRPSILADAVEAVIGAVYLDAGYEVAQQLVNRLFSSMDFQATMQASAKDPKTELQEWLQGRRMRLPAYRVVATLGAAHRQTFDVECAIEEEALTERGIGASRRAAEQAAAAAMLIQLKTRHP
ncbi:MAG: ribonuclease III [Burkholderiales bacterium]|nr:ribonuclease III [Burkholderiales bacterium]